MPLKIVAYAVLGILALFGVLMMGDGITGMAVSGEYVKELCSNAFDCKEQDVCCLFYGELSGVCGTADECDEIFELTKLQNGKQTLITSNKNNMEVSSSYFTETFIGGIIFLLSIFLTYMMIRDNYSERSKHH